MAALVILSACGIRNGEYVHSGEARSNAYYGQSVADLYENFGIPTRGIKYSDTERALIYRSQDIEKEWAHRYFRKCVLVFYLKNDYVVDWAFEGNKCIVNRLGGAIMGVNETPNSYKDVEGEYGLFDTPQGYSRNLKQESWFGLANYTDDYGRYTHQISADAF